MTDLSGMTNKQLMDALWATADQPENQAPSPVAPLPPANPAAAMSDEDLLRALQTPAEADMARALQAQAGMPQTAAPEAPKEESWRDYARGAIASAAQGILFNYGDELKGYVRALPTLATGGDYAAEAARITDEQRAQERQFGEAHPNVDMAGKVAGAVMGGAALPTKMLAAPTLAGRLAKAAGVGAGLGALGGSGEGVDAESRVGGAVSGGVIGGVAGPVGELVLSGAGAGVNKLLGRKPGIPTAAAPRQDLADEFGIPLTRGQASGDVRRQATEEAMRHGAKGGWAQDRMVKFGDKQQTAMREAEQGILAKIAGGQTPIDDAAAAGEDVLEAVRRKAGAVRNVRGQLYDAAEKTAAVVDVKAIQSDLPRVMQEKLSSESILVNPLSTPKTHAFLSSLGRDVEKFAKKGPDGQIVGVNLSWVEGQRKVVNKLLNGTDSTDGEALRVTLRALDDWELNVVDDALMSGDRSSLEAFKKARAGARVFFKTFTAKGASDDAGRAVENMLQKQDLNGHDVANLLYGRVQLGAGQGPAHLAEKLKYILGPESPEWDAVRQGAWLKLTAPPASGQPGPKALSTKINDFVSGKGKALAERLFTPEERAEMVRYATALDITVPSKLATNESKSGYKLGNLLKGPLTTAVGIAGVGAAGPVGGAAAWSAARAATEIWPALKAGVATTRMPSRTIPINPLVPALPELARDTLAGPQGGRATPQLGAR